MDYYRKYLKYKLKYIELKKQLGGSGTKYYYCKVCQSMKLDLDTKEKNKLIDAKTKRDKLESILCKMSTIETFIKEKTSNNCKKCQHLSTEHTILYK